MPIDHVSIQIKEYEKEINNVENVVGIFKKTKMRITSINKELKFPLRLRDKKFSA